MVCLIFSLLLGIETHWARDNSGLRVGTIYDALYDRPSRSVKISRRAASVEPKLLYDLFQRWQ